MASDHLCTQPTRRRAFTPIGAGSRRAHYTAAMPDATASLAPAAPTEAAAFTFNWTHRFADLGEGFYTELNPQGLPDPHWVATSADCAHLLGLPADWATREDWQALQVFSGNAAWEGMRPLASVYSGHQFGQWAGQLGDGRALSLGELVTAEHGPMELQLKGAGRTPYSRMGDGRAVLRSSIREFLGSEAMHALGIPTTRALSITGSALPVRRERAETAAVVTRVAPSFIRFGHFEHFAHHGQPERLQQLLEFVIDHYYPQARDHAVPAAALLAAVSVRTARLMAQWQAVGFCHGVMNTDNMSILGLTIDYGPFGFLDAFEPGHICNHSDHQGRYAYARQPGAGLWNLHALGQALLPLMGNDTEVALDALETYKATFAPTLQTLMRAKLGLRTQHDSDEALIDEWLQALDRGHVDYTIAFRRLGGFDSAETAHNAPVRDLFIDQPRYEAWAALYAARLRSEDSVDAERALRMNAVNPSVVLRNHLAETAIQRAEAGDFSEVHRLHALLSRPFDEHPEAPDATGFPPDWARHIEVSCSS
jgi:uncharacterized protein YdiU (UPF0061 family)